MKKTAAALAAIAGFASAASATTMNWAVNIEGFGGSAVVSSDEVLVWADSFSLGAVQSFDSISLDLAHDYAGDLALRLINNDTNAEYYFIGSAAQIGTIPGDDDGVDNFDADHLGDGVAFLLANTVTYTLVESGAGSTFITGTSGTVAAGTYNATGWAAGSFAAGNWTIELWDTWGSLDTGSIGNVALDYTLVPAPATAAMLGLGGLVALRRRR